MIRSKPHAVVVVAFVLAASTGCATKGFVTDRVADVNTRVDSIESTLDGNVAETKNNTAHLGEVDKTANIALDTATSADATARSARDAADDALARTASLEATDRQLLFETVVAEGYDRFSFGAAALPESVLAQLDSLVEQLHAQPTGIYLEIEGHTDATGPEMYNEQLGRERAEAVKLYLYEMHQIPLHKMNVISFGERKPIAGNDTREGRAQNRRVVVRVLATGKPMPSVPTRAAAP